MRMPAAVGAILLGAGAITACGERRVPSEPAFRPPAPGRFDLSEMRGLQGRTAGPRGAGPAAGPGFDLGPISNTTNFYFLLRNTGGRTITGVTITQSSPYFTISPLTIDSLPPDTSAAAGVLPIVRLTAIHGTGANGLGIAPLMPMGPDSASIAIAGTTTDTAGQPVPLSLQVGAAVTAEVMDIRLFDGTKETDLTRPQAYMLAQVISPDYMPEFVLDSETITFTNSGNVPITVTVWPVCCVNTPPELDAHTLAPGATDTLPMVTVNGYPDGVLELDGGGTITDLRKLPLARNGHAYVWIQHP